MSSLPSPAPQATSRSRPVDARERVTLIDVLRGFALAGVFVSNARMHLSGWRLLPREATQALLASPVNAVAEFLYVHLIFEKAMSIFSFLFGLGFAIQLDRAEARGANIGSIYARRLGVLILIGLTHLFAIWYGDVLTMYALTGFSLLVLRKLPDRKLVLWAIGLILVAPLVVSSAIEFVPRLTSSPEAVQASAAESTAQVEAIKARTLAGFASGSYITTARANADFYLHVFLRPMLLSYMMIVLGRFLLGLVAGRRRLFHDAGEHLPFFRRLLGWGLAVGLVGNAVVALIDHLTRIEVLAEKALWRRLAMPSIWEVGVLGFAAVYVAGLSLLFQRPLGRRVLSVLAPAGQMALTNYLCQSVLSQLVFYGYGLGLIGKVGPAASISITFGLFWVQVLVSHLWLARFHFGPAEWLWRSLTYGKRQPMRRGGRAITA